MIDLAAIKALTEALVPWAKPMAEAVAKQAERKGEISTSLNEALTKKFVDVIDRADVANIARRMQEREKTVKIRKQMNLEEVLRLAMELASEDPEKEKRPVDPDWFFAWVDGAENVTDEYIQELWARVLKQNLAADEKLISLRALDSMRLMSRDDAMTLARFRSLRSKIGGLFVNSWKVVDDTVGRNELDALLDLNLVVREPHQSQFVTCGDSLSIVWSIPSGKLMPDPFWGYRLSARGVELINSLPPISLQAENEAGGLVDFDSARGYLSYARLVASSFGEEFTVALAVNRGRRRDPSDPKAQRSREIIFTHRWHREEQRWERTADFLSTDFEPDELAALEVA